MVKLFLWWTPQSPTTLHPQVHSFILSSPTNLTCKFDSKLNPIMPHFPQKESLQTEGPQYTWQNVVSDHG